MSRLPAQPRWCDRLSAARTWKTKDIFPWKLLGCSVSFTFIFDPLGDRKQSPFVVETVAWTISKNKTEKINRLNKYEIKQIRQPL